MVYTVATTMLPNSTIQSLTEHNSKPKMFQGPFQDSLHTDMQSEIKGEDRTFPPKKRVRGGRRREMDVGRRLLIFFHAINLRCHYTVAISILQIFLLASCLSILASPVAQTLWFLSSTGLRAEVLPTYNVPLFHITSSSAASPGEKLLQVYETRPIYFHWCYLCKC